MPMFKKQMIVVLAIALIAIVGTIYGASEDEVITLDEGTPQSVENIPEKIFVYVTGAVNSPGMVELNGSDLRVADAVNASGGLLPTADVDNFNMAETISDGQHIRVPEKNAVRSIAPIASDVVEKGGGSTDGVVNINTADADELDTLPGIGPAMAQRIIDYRQLNGGFKSIDEIQNVRGIGAKKFENIKSRIKI